VNTNDDRTTFPGHRQQDDVQTVALMEKLRRLRDRVAHRTGHAALVNELREQLRDYMQERINSQSTTCDF
jgi:hypothetical protein